MTQSTIESDTELSTLETIDIEQALNPFETDDGSNKDRKAHYVSPGDNVDFQRKYGAVESSQELMNNARFHQGEIVALCGYKWVPKFNPASYPVCGPCAEIAGNRLLGE